MKKRKIYIISLLIICSLFLCSCSGNEPVADENGEMMFITPEEIGLQTQGREGFFVYNPEGTFTPIMNQLEGYKGLSDKSTPDRYLWFTNNEINISKLIPVVTKNSPLVMIYDSDSSMPTKYQLEEYEYKGYTIGCHIYKEPDNSLFFTTAGALSSSYAGRTVSGVTGKNDYRISTINGVEELPYKNVDNNMQLLLGLEKDKYYDFEFFQGTKYRKLTTIADTMVLQSVNVMTLKNPYTKTTEGYFIVNLPDNLKDGYYYICGLGLFRYEN